MKETLKGQDIPLGLSKRVNHDLPGSSVTYFFAIPIWSWFGERYDAISDEWVLAKWYLRLQFAVDRYYKCGFGIRVNYGAARMPNVELRGRAL